MNALRIILILLVLGLAACGANETAEKFAAKTSTQSSTERPPNFIIIYTDDHGFADLGIHGIRDDIKTPHMDALARSGALMTQGYVTAPVCSPSRAGLLSGQYQNAFGIESNFDFMTAAGFQRFSDVQTIAETLKTKDYKTAMAGKWHVGPKRLIPEHGFDQFLATLGVGKHSTNVDKDGNIVPMRGFAKGYHIDLGADFSTRFIAQNSDEPFFLYWAPRAPHVPMNADPKYLARFPQDMPNRRRHALAMMSAVDDGVGRIVAELRAANLTDNTLIFLVSDNGAEQRLVMPDRGHPGAGWNGSLNAPLNGEKMMLLEGGIRVPFMASWPGQVDPGTVYAQPVMTFDIAATITAAAGAAADPKLPGQNLLPFLNGREKTRPHEQLFWRLDSQTAIRDRDWKLIEFDGQDYLFDLNTDPYETLNRAAEHPARVEQLRAGLKEWTDSLPAARPEHAGSKKRSREYYKYYLGKVEDVDWDYVNFGINHNLSPREITQAAAKEMFPKD